MAQPRSPARKSRGRPSRSYGKKTNDLGPFTVAKKKYTGYKGKVSSGKSAPLDDRRLALERKKLEKRLSSQRSHILKSAESILEKVSQVEASSKKSRNIAIASGGHKGGVCS